MSDPAGRIAEIVKADDIVLFMKGTALFPQCGFSSRAIAILDRLGATYQTVDVLQDPEIRQGVKDYSDWPTVPVAIFRFLGRPGALNAGQAAALSVVLMVLTAATVLLADRVSTIRRGVL